MLRKLFVMTIIAMCIQGCASNAPKEKSPEDALANIKAALQEAKQSETAAEAGGVPPQVSEALLPDYNPQLQPRVQRAIEEERFDITVNRMAARAFFMGLVKGTPVNMVVHPDVKGVLSLDLKSVTIDEVLEVTRDVYGYEYQKNRAGYFIMPARLQSKIFNVSYLNVSRKGESNTRVTSGQIVNGDLQSGRGGRGGRGVDDINDVQGGSRSQAFAASRIATESEADFWNGLADTVRTLIGEGEGRSVVISPQAGLVVVRAMPGELRDVEAFLARAESSLHRQVIIEAKVIEVRLNDAHQAGINWAKLEQDGSRQHFGSQLELINGGSELVDAAGNLLTSGLTSTRSLPGFGNLFALGTASDDFALIIRLLDQQGDVNVLSSPRVSTVNNQKAVIKVGSDEFFVTEIASTTVTGTTTTTTPQIILTPFFSGIALDVTPQINERSEVILHIHPSISEVTDQVKEITVSGEDQSLPLAFSTVRETDSIVRARSGEVIIIGGLMQNQSADTVGGVPGLSDIPLLGRLFQQTQRTNERSELVILLKPIVIGDDTWQTELGQVTNRIDGLRR
ncbi:MAG TPA: pilus (MSHA type) biogenesis protein MshL [Gammaproteobacteria bacterium]